MNLIHAATGEPVQLGDAIGQDGISPLYVDHFAQPLLADGEGKVTLRGAGQPEGMSRSVLPVSVIGAQWVDRPGHV